MMLSANPRGSFYQDLLICIHTQNKALYVYVATSKDAQRAQIVHLDRILLNRIQRSIGVSSLGVCGVNPCDIYSNLTINLSIA